jgi:hypothetical protein
VVNEETGSREWEHLSAAYRALPAKPGSGADAQKRPLRCRCRARLRRNVRVSAGPSRHSGEGCKSQTVKVQPTTLAPSHAGLSVTVSTKR